MTPASVPVSVMIGRGNESESRRLIPLLEQVRVKGRRGRPRRRPFRVHADTIYDTMMNRMYLQRRHVRCNIPRRARHPVGRPPLFDRDAMKRTRYSVERFFSWMKCFRRIDSRYDRSADAYMGFVHIGCILIIMREVMR